MKSYTLFISILFLVLFTTACESTPQDGPVGASPAGSVQNEEQVQENTLQEADAQEPEAQWQTACERLF